MALLRSSSLRGELFLEQIHNSDAPVSCDIPQKLVTFGVSRPCRPPGHDLIGLLVGHPSKVARIRDQICGAPADCLPVWRVPVTARKDDAPAAFQAAIVTVAGLGSCSVGGGLIQTTSG